MPKRSGATKSDSRPRGVVLVDGVHTSDNTIDGIRRLSAEIGFDPLRCVWIGGTEKIKDPESFRETFKKELGLEVIMDGDPENGVCDPMAGLRRALENRDVDLVVQLSGSPQVNRAITNRYAALAVGFGARYVAGGTTFAEKGSDLEADVPSVGLYATDKRVGKTAFGNYIGRLLSGLTGGDTAWSAIIMTHSRGGPPEPPIVNIFDKGDGRPAAELTPEEMFSRRFRPEFLEHLLKFGLHGASDVFEDALIMSEYLNGYEAETGRDAPTLSIIGCRRAGAGYFHEFAVSNVDRGIARAAQCPGNYILHEGSGGEHPPVKVDATVTLVPSNANLDMLSDFPGLPATDLVILAHCQPETADQAAIERVEARIKERNSDLPIVRTLFEPEILGARDKLKRELTGKRAYYLSTAPESVKDRLSEALERDYQCRILGISCNLSRDDLMRRDIQAALTHREPPEAFLIEIKARGVEAARLIHETSGLPYYYTNNVPRQVDRDGNLVPGNPDLDREILTVLKKGAERFNARRGTDFPTG